MRSFFVNRGNRYITLILASFSLSLFPSCVGYRLGNTKQAKLKHVNNIYVPLVDDQTLEVKLAPQVTNAIIKAISNDGTFRITRANNSDAALNAKIQTIKYDEFRSSRLDTLRAEELIIHVVIEWQLVDNAGKVLEQGTSTGASRFFADSNQRLSRDNAKSDALQEAAQKITSRISNGF